MNKKIIQKLKKLPKNSGVYIFRDKNNKVIYIGKAVNLKNRVSSYFENANKDTKTQSLVINIAKLDILETSSEFEALILESDLIKRYKPKYNIRLKDDKSYVYLKVTKEKFPRINIVRQITDTDSGYLGPFIDSQAVRSILKIARKIFPYCSCSRANDTCLYFHLGLCPGHSEEYISQRDYARNIQGIKRIFAGKTASLEKEFKKQMRSNAANRNYELAANFRDKLKYLERIKKSQFISERDLSADLALVQLQKSLRLPNPASRIECYDISNILGTSATGSMIVFKDGIAAPKDYRRFQIKTVRGANDFAMMAEIVARRFRRHTNTWPLPDLIILDGGKGQLSAVTQNVIIPKQTKIIALAKKREEVFIPLDKKYKKIIIPKDSPAYYLIQRIRDEAHRFAITYHRSLRSKKVFNSSLDDIIGVGPKTKKKLLNHFGSVKNIKEATETEIAKVVSSKLAKKIKENL